MSEGRNGRAVAVTILLTDFARAVRVTWWKRGNMQIFTKTKHVSDDALGLHALDDLPESDRQPVTDHLSRCAHCRQRFADVREFVSFLRLAAASQSVSRAYVIH